MMTKGLCQDANGSQSIEAVGNNQVKLSRREFQLIKVLE